MKPIGKFSSSPCSLARENFSLLDVCAAVPGSLFFLASELSGVGAASFALIRSRFLLSTSAAQLRRSDRAIYRVNDQQTGVWSQPPGSLCRVKIKTGQFNVAMKSNR